MAGTYPDVPGRRMAIDRDGSQGFQVATNFSSVIGALSSGTMLALNDETIAHTVAGSGIAIIFPELRDIVGIYLEYSETGAGSSPGITNVFTSADTTNGIDGSWTDQGAQADGRSIATVVRMRNNIKAVNWTGIKALRFAQAGGGASITYRVLHLFGDPAAGENPNRLRLWHPTLDQEIGGAYFDWADIARSSTADRDFRVKNNSATLTANGVNLSFAAPTDASPSVPAQHLLRKDSDGDFAATTSIATLAPGAVSEVIHARRVTPSNAFLSLWTARLLVEPTTMT